MKISATQQKTIDILKEHGRKIIRLPGGFWTYPDCPNGDIHDGIIYHGEHPVWDVDIRTVRALERQGYLKRCNEFPEEWRDSRELNNQ